MAMSVIYANSAERRVYLDVPVTPVTNSMDVTLLKDGEVVHTFETVTFTGGRYSVVVPFSFCQLDNELRIEWKFNYIEDAVTYEYSNQDRVLVVTPILSFAEIRSVVADQNITDTEVAEVESAVRHIIQAHCGQTFGHYNQKIWVPGNGRKSLQLPQRLITLKGVNGFTDTDWFNVSGDGFFLRYYPLGVPPVKADYYGLHMHVGGVIHNPNHVDYGKFRDTMGYEIDGEWGYESVPSAVHEAAVLLTAMYADADSEYRDRYLTSMTAADWRIQFHAGAFAQTGHVRADQLLADYVLRRGWAVL